MMGFMAERPSYVDKSVRVRHAHRHSPGHRSRSRMMNWEGLGSRRWGSRSQAPVWRLLRRVRRRRANHWGINCGQGDDHADQFAAFDPALIRAFGHRVTARVLLLGGLFAVAILHGRLG